MSESESLWERFVACEANSNPNGGLQAHSQRASNTQQSILAVRSINLSSASIALRADANTTALMRDLSLRPVTEILSDKASRELSCRGRFVDFVRFALSNCTRDPDGKAKKAEIAVRSIQAIHARVIVDRPARDLQSLLLAELDDISPDHVPQIVDALLKPCLTSARRRGDSAAAGAQAHPHLREMGATEATAFLVALDILPKMLGLTAAVPALARGAPVPEGARGLSGMQYQERVVTRMLRARWPEAVAIGMCQSLRDLDLNAGQLRYAVSRVLRHLRKDAKLDELPSLTYQLLLLAGRNCKEAALEGVIRVFDRLDAAADERDRADDSMRRGNRLGTHTTESLREKEGTVLLHFNFAMKQDHNLVTCLLKGFERRAAPPEISRAFTPFRVALLLSLSTIHRFSQQVFDLLQAIVAKCLQHDHRVEESSWLEGAEAICRSGGRGADGAPDGDTNGAGGESEAEGEGARHRPLASHSSARTVESVLLQVVRSSRGWDHLVGSLVALGLQFLDRCPTAGTGKGAASAVPGTTKSLLETSQRSRDQRAGLRASQLGRALLTETFKLHEIARRQILTSVLEQVTARSHGVMSYVKLLEQVSKKHPQLLLQDAEALRDVFAYISALAPGVVERLLGAATPLLQLRPRLQDSVVLPLRKALFSREERARLVAVGGLIKLLGVQTRAGVSPGVGGGAHGGTQLSQASQTSESHSPPLGFMTASPSTGGSALSLAEGFGLLRRCLTQQLVVRAKLYDGLLSSFKRGSFEFRVDAVSLLAGHLRRFVRRSGGGAGLVLGRCLDPCTGDIFEPLPLLLGCLQRMLIIGRTALTECSAASADAGGPLDDDRAYDSGSAADGGEIPSVARSLGDSLDELDGDIRKLSSFLSNAALEEFGLDKVSDFSPSGGSAARTKLATAALLCGSYEALMQGALFLTENPPRDTPRSAKSRRLPGSGSVRALLKLFDRRQILLDLVSPHLPTASQQRTRKAAVGSAGSMSAVTTDSGDADRLSAATAGTGAARAGRPGFSSAGCFGLTLHSGGMPCLSIRFVDDMLAVLNIDPEIGSESEGDTERDPGTVDAGAGDPPVQVRGRVVDFGRVLLGKGAWREREVQALCNCKLRASIRTKAASIRSTGHSLVAEIPQSMAIVRPVLSCLAEAKAPALPTIFQAVREDLEFQRLVLETCRGHLRQLRTGTVADCAGLAAEVGGGISAKGSVAALSGASGALRDGPQDEADAVRAGKLAAQRCTTLAPLVMKEVFRQLTEGNTSGAAKAAAAAAKATNTKTNKGKGKSGSTDKTKKRATPPESLAELALSCLEECVAITSYSSSRARTQASRTAKFLETAYKDLPDSTVPPEDPAKGAMGTSALGRHTGALLHTLTMLLEDGQGKEAEILCRVLAQLTRLLKLEPECLVAHAASLRKICQQQPLQSSSLGKVVMSLYIQASMSVKARGGNIDALQDLATQIQACVGVLDEVDEEDEAPPLSFHLINNFTIVSVSEATIDALVTCVDDIEYASRLLQKAAVARQARDAAQTPEGLSSVLRGESGRGVDSSQSSATISEDDLSSAEDSANSDRNSDSDAEAAGIRSDGGSGERDPLDRRETILCDRLQAVMQAMAILVESTLDGRSTEKLISNATRIFRTMTKVLNVRLSLKRSYVGRGLTRVLAFTKRFARAVYYLLPQLESEKGTKITKNHIARQSRLVPVLVYEMEQYDRHLIKLDKLCKRSLDLTRWVSIRVDRDFRINRDAIATCQEQLRGMRQRKEKRKGKQKTKATAAKKQKSTARVEAPTMAGDSSEDDDEDPQEQEGYDRAEDRRRIGGLDGDTGKQCQEEDDDEGEDGQDKGDDSGLEEDEDRDAGSGDDQRGP